ncbi:hypothetical protein MPH_13385 [Macrophomina phaseolina MS6]|uniref:Uncharacterized protein n=1 Tax=Macrophomina phaseolina (strain MS6) TaxID=1126212 RepID=K2RYQ4_MACPH|nr:hypothetical protein MPH_13385 [Macrophomina phaseolina MS6]
MQAIRHDSLISKTLIQPYTKQDIRRLGLRIRQEALVAVIGLPESRWPVREQVGLVSRDGLALAVVVVEPKRARVVDAAGKVDDSGRTRRRCLRGCQEAVLEEVGKEEGPEVVGSQLVLDVVGRVLALVEREAGIVDQNVDTRRECFDFLRCAADGGWRNEVYLHCPNVRTGAAGLDVGSDFVKLRLRARNQDKQLRVVLCEGERRCAPETGPSYAGDGHWGNRVGTVIQEECRANSPTRPLICPVNAAATSLALVPCPKSGREAIVRPEET